MALTRSFTNAYQMTDYTQELLLIPNRWGLINELGLFSTASVAANNITVELRNQTLGIVADQPRGARNNVGTDYTRSAKAFLLTHHPLDDTLTAQDLQGKRAYGMPNEAETEAAAIARKLERIRMSHAATLEVARAQAICLGTQYAPNGTVSQNFYTEFGITRLEVDFTFGTTTTNIVQKGETIIASIQDNLLSGEIAGGIIALCSPEFFSKLIAHASINDAYKYYQSTQEPLRQRLGSGLFRRFMHGGIEYIEYRGAYNGTRLIPAGDAYFLPTNTSDVFQTYFGPANKLSLANTLGEEAYVWTFRDPKDEMIEVQSESNFINLIRRPQAVARGFTSN